MSDVRNRRSSSSTAPEPLPSPNTKSGLNTLKQPIKDRIEKCMNVVIACVMIDMMGISLTVPINVAYALQVQGTPEACIADQTSAACSMEMDELKAKTGYLMFSASFAMLISTMWMPLFSDKYGRRNAVIVSIFGSILGFLLTALAFNFEFLIFAKIVGGLFGGTATVASAFVVDLYEQKERPKRFANLSNAAISAFIFGPFIGGALSQFGLRTPLWVSTGFSIVAWVLTLIYVQDPQVLLRKDKKEEEKVKSDDKDVKKVLLDADHHSQDSNKSSNENDDQKPKEEDNDAIKKLEEGESSTVSGAGKKEDDNKKKGENEKELSPYKVINCWLIAIETGLTTLAFNVLPSLLPLLLFEEKLGIVKPSMTLEEAGERVALWVMMLVPVFGSIQVIMLKFFYAKLVKKYGLLELGAVGCCIFSMGIILLPFYPSPGFMFISQFFLAFGNSMQTNVSNSYLSKYAPKSQAAKTLAMGTVSDTIGTMVGPILMTNLFSLNRNLPFFLAAALGFIAGGICAGLRLVYGDPNEEKKSEKKDGASDKIKAMFEGALEEKIDESENLKYEAGDPLYIHPAAIRQNILPEHLYTMNLLEEFLYHELVDKYHISGLASRRKQAREHFLQAHKEALASAISMWHDPNESPESLQLYLNDVSLFFLQHGHTDWAQNIPEAQFESVQGMMKQAHVR